MGKRKVLRTEREGYTFFYDIFKKGNGFREHKKKYQSKKYKKSPSRCIALWWLIKKLEGLESLKSANYL